MSKQVLKVALPGFRADTDTNLDHFALWADSTDTTDNILIKEQTRGLVTITSGATGTITHSLGYVPLVFVFGQISPDTWQLLCGQNAGNTDYIEVNTTQLIIHNQQISSANYKYLIFYDKIF